MEDKKTILLKMAIDYVKSDDFNKDYPEDVLDYAMPILQAIRDGYVLTKEVVKNET